MISLRYHVITIVAVFLALAIGLLAGSAFVEPELVDQLRNQTQGLQEQLRDRTTQLSDARVDLDALDAFADAAMPYLTENALIGQSVVVVAQEGVEDDVIGETQRALQEAGATVVAVISARNELASEDPAARAGLAEAVGATGATGEELLPSVASALAGRLADGAAGLEPESDVLWRLLSEGFLGPIGSGPSEATLEEIGSEGQVVVILGGGPNESPPLMPEDFLVPLVEELVELGRRVAAGESATTAVGFVESVRGTDGIVTVDDLDLTVGGAALVLGLDRLLLTGQGGAYGLKDGAQPLPPPP